MKSNLTSILLFLFFCFGTNHSFAQDDVRQESDASTSAHSDLQTQPNEHPSTPRSLHHDHADLPDVLIDRVENESDTFQAKFLNMLFILALLIGFMILASWALKRMMKTKLSQLNTGSAIKVLETRYLSPRATIYVVEIQKHTIVIAESPTAVTYLTSLPLEAEETSV